MFPPDVRLRISQCIPQGARRIKVEAREPLAMKTAILSPLAMGSRGRYTLVDGIAVGLSLGTGGRRALPGLSTP